MNAEIRILKSGDEAVLNNVARDVFDNALEPALVAEFLRDERHHLAVAIEDGQVVGFASGVHYVHPDKPPELWINEVGVAPSHYRRGIGNAIMRALLQHAKALGCKEAWVLTDRSNRAAMASSKMTPTAVMAGSTAAVIACIISTSPSRTGSP